MDLSPNEIKVVSATGSGWDQKTAVILREAGLNQDQIGVVLGLIAEHRQTADMEGYQRGFDNGYKWKHKDTRL